MKTITKLALALASWVIASAAHAIPTLQLDIAGGTYIGGTEQSIVTSGNQFDLYTYLKPNQYNLASDVYYLSIALLPTTSVAGDFGSIKVNGNVFNVSGDMVYGTPPLEAMLSASNGDLPTHGVFPTYYLELGFAFDGSQSGLYNVQNQAGSGPLSGTGMYYKQFTMDISGLAAGYDLHFDLYNSTLISGNPIDFDVTKFAPFSHDAGTNRTPEPGSVALVGVALLLLASLRRRALSLA